MGFNELIKKPQTFDRSEAFLAAKTLLEADSRSEQEIKSGLRIVEVFCCHSTCETV